MNDYSVTANEYKSLSKSYDSRFQSYIRGVIKHILATAKITPDTKALDLGCGTGEILLALAKANPNAKELAGIDLSEDMLSIAKAKLSDFKAVTLRQGNIEQIPYDDNHFDLVVSSGVLHYVSDAEALAREVHRVLKPGGHFLLIDMAQESLATKISSALRKITDPGAVRFYSKRSAAKLLSDQGLQIVSSELFRGGYFGLFLVDAVKPSRHETT